MKKLKTLKDFYVEGEYYSHDEAVERELLKDIKALAIKWVKEGLKKNRNFFKVMMEMHNLTDEDLITEEDLEEK